MFFIYKYLSSNKERYKDERLCAGTDSLPCPLHAGILRLPQYPCDQRILSSFPDSLHESRGGIIYNKEVISNKIEFFILSKPF